MENAPSVMVCVTTQKACERLIKAGAEAAAPMGWQLHVIHVATGESKFFGCENEGEALEYLFDASKKYGADMNVLRSSDVVETLTDFARNVRAKLIIFGESGESDSPNGIIQRVGDELSDEGVSIAVQRRN